MQIRPIPANVIKCIGRNLYNVDGHPLKWLYNHIESSFHERPFLSLQFPDPNVKVDENFTQLRIPEGHPGRSQNDTFYINESTVLRTHMSAHQRTLIKAAVEKLNCAPNNMVIAVGDVYRRDTVDKTHYPVFHQVEGISVYSKDTYSYEELLSMLKAELVRMAQTLFGENVEYRWATDNFPFVVEGIEMEVLLNGNWVEILGAGVIHPELMENFGYPDHTGYAFGLGLERLTMIKCQIPDIRYFWTEDERFYRQFEGGLARFVPYSNMPAIRKDLSFWINNSIHENIIHQEIREVEPAVIEDVSLVDRFNKKDKVSKTFRVTYRSNDHTLTHDYVNEIHDRVKENLSRIPSLTIR